jgi:hypothetical protein
MGLSLSPATLLGYAFLALSLPFNVVYWTDKDRWWALIPGALFAVAAVIVLVFFSLLQPGTGPFYIVLHSTLALVFLATWLTARRLDWALWAGGGFAGAAVLSVWVPSVTNFAVLALAMGGYIVYRQLRGTPRVLPPSYNASRIARRSFHDAFRASDCLLCLLHHRRHSRPALLFQALRPELSLDLLIR